MANSIPEIQAHTSLVGEMVESPPTFRARSFSKIPVPLDSGNVDSQSRVHYALQMHDFAPVIGPDGRKVYTLDDVPSETADQRSKNSNLVNLPWSDHTPKEDDLPLFKKLPEKFKLLPMGESAVEFIEVAGVGLLTSSLFTNPVPVSSWAMVCVESAKIVGFAAIVGGRGMRNFSEKTSRIMIKSGAIATASAIIGTLAIPLPTAVALTVGPVAWVTVAASVFFS